MSDKKPIKKSSIIFIIIFSLIVAVITAAAVVTFTTKEKAVYDFLMPPLSVIIAILIFFIIILVHELGHFIAAKICKIYVKEFSFGMGPTIFSKQGKETKYSLRAFPVGGYCYFENDIEEFDDQTGNAKEPNPRAYNKKPVWQRFIVILSGPLINLILGYFVVMAMLLATPLIPSRIIYDFRDQSVSDSSMKVNDEILSVEGMPVFTISDVSYKLQTGDRKNEKGNLIYDFEVRRGGEVITLKDVEFMTTGGDGTTSGVYFDFYVYALEKNFKNVTVESFNTSLSTGRIIIMTLWDVIRGKYGLNELSGPIGVGSLISEVVQKYSFADVLDIVSLITINLGIFNLLPIPGLDGSRLVFLVIELIRRKPLKPEVEGMIHFVGFALLFLLIIVVTFNDILKLVQG